jgi:flavin-dependent dehydrogenase
MYDAAIIGLGPAGATLARLLAQQGKRVIAIDKKEPGGFEKPCGGLLAPDAQKVLSRFNLTLPASVLVDPQIFAVRTIDLSSGLIRHYQRFYMNLDRAAFDRWLISLIPPQVDVMKGRCSGIRRSGGHFLVEFEAEGQKRQVETARVIGADGANSLVRRQLFPAFKPQHYVSVQQWFKDTNATPFYSCIFDPENTDCYSWALSKDGYFIFGGAYPPQNARQRFENQKEKLEQAGFCFGEPLKTEGCMVLRPQHPRAFCLGGKDAYLIGEAAGFISPSSLEGMSFAMESAYQLSRALEKEQTDRFYRAYTRKIRGKLLLKILKCPFLFQPTLRRLVMASGLSSVQVIGGEEQIRREHKDA